MLTKPKHIYSTSLRLIIYLRCIMVIHTETFFGIKLWNYLFTQENSSQMLHLFLTKTQLSPNSPNGLTEVQECEVTRSRSYGESRASSRSPLRSKQTDILAQTSTDVALRSVTYLHPYENFSSRSELLSIFMFFNCIGKKRKVSWNLNVFTTKSSSLNYVLTPKVA